MKFLDHKTPEDMLRLMLADNSTDAPAHSITYAKNLFRTVCAPKQVSPLRRLVAMLSADLAPNRAAFGERSASGAAGRQMLFECEENGIDIRVSGTGDTVDVRGQLLGEGLGAATVELTGGNFTAQCELDENAGFAFAKVPTGEYDLTIRYADSEIAIEKLTL